MIRPLVVLVSIGIRVIHQLNCFNCTELGRVSAFWNRRDGSWQGRLHWLWTRKHHDCRVVVLMRNLFLRSWLHAGRLFLGVVGNNSASIVCWGSFFVRRVIQIRFSTFTVCIAERHQVSPLTVSCWGWILVSIRSGVRLLLVVVVIWQKLSLIYLPRWLLMGASNNILRVHVVVGVSWLIVKPLRCFFCLLHFVLFWWIYGSVRLINVFVW